jgi:alkanesulfonate monooxygenase SsuD/methylene tetrahydromethanopterin reductase-like flavin-dependent oxidoreductase (luciferase family)
MPKKVAVGMGIMEFPFSGAAAYWRWVDLLEAGGVDSLWQTDRLVSPTPFLECMSVMAALAGRTRRLKFGVNVLSLAMRDAVLVARQCEDKVDFEGVHYHLSGAQCYPKPVQPDLPMWIGGSSEAAIRRTAKYGTGWQAGPETPEQAKIVVAAIREAAAAEGRAIDDDHYGAGIPFRFGRADEPGLAPLFEAYRKRTGRDPQDYFAIGDAQAITDKIGAYVAAGVSKFILRPAAKGDDEIMAQTRRLIDEVLPLVAARWPKPAKRAIAAE